MSKFKHETVAIFSHVLTTVPVEDLKKYLLGKKIEELLMISHPLFYKKGFPGSNYEYYLHGNLKNKKIISNFKFPSILLYVKDIFLNMFWVLKTRKKWDLVIAIDNLNTISALLLKKMGLVKKVVYYTIDFTPQRFSDKLVNDFYHFLDKIAVKYADLTWNVSPRIAEGREKIKGLNRDKYNKQIEVPIGIWYDRIPRKKYQEIEKNCLVYAGSLLPHQGIQLVLRAIPLIAQDIKNLNFKVVGMGAYESELKKIIKELKIEKYVQMLGYQKRHEDVEEILSTGAVAMAMYHPQKSAWSHYADPSKIKSYLGVGLPVITTNVTHLANKIKTKNCGLVVDYDKKSLAKAVIRILKNHKLQKKMRENALEFAKKFNWQNIFDDALSDKIIN